MRRSRSSTESPRRSARIRRRTRLDSLSTNTTPSPVKHRADSLDLVCRIPHVCAVVPRNKRFDVQVLNDAIVFQGRSIRFQVPVNHIDRVYQLPIPRCGVVDVVVQLSKQSPVVKGNHLVFRFGSHERLDIIWGAAAAHIPNVIPQAQALVPHSAEEEEEDDEEEEDVDLDVEEPSHLTASIFANSIAAIAKLHVVTPGSFRSTDGHHAVGAAVGVDDAGFLYLLEDEILFLHKPVTHVRFKDVVKIYCSPVGGLRRFQLVIFTKDNQELVFEHMEKREHEPILKFLRKKNLPVDPPNENSDNAALNCILDSDDDLADESSDYCPSESESVDNTHPLTSQ